MSCEAVSDGHGRTRRSALTDELLPRPAPCHGLHLGGEFGSDGGVSSLDDFKDDDNQSRRAEWEHLSPETITALEEERKTSESQHGSPSQIPRRKKSSEPKSPALRPVVFDGREDDEVTNQIERERLSGNPIPFKSSSIVCCRVEPTKNAGS